MTSLTPPLSNPFPGLRPFGGAESHLFFGRSQQIDELLARLERSRFVVVMGASGSGKSSLVRAGLLPALHGGFSGRVGSHWRIVTFRPGGSPVHNMARALASSDVFGHQGSDPEIAVAQIEASLRRSSLGLADQAGHDERLFDGRLLVVVDQFEELFRFDTAPSKPGGREDAAAMVKLLIEAARSDHAPVDVVLTMRSDFLGDCAQFRDLPETVNEGLYLVPRLTRVQLHEAITGPVAVGGATIAPRLVHRVLNDAGTDPDLLPVVQHALMRTWDVWANDHDMVGPIDLAHYEATGGLENALSSHADEAYYELDDDRSRTHAELMFKRLTELGSDGREVRRPSALAEIAAVAEASAQEITEIIGHFEQEGRSFVTVSDDQVVDISHESLIRQWPRLRVWVGQEADSRASYLRLANAAARWERNEAALLRHPDLQIAVNWWNGNQPNQAWAERYASGFGRASTFLDRSRSAAKRRRMLAATGVVVLVALTIASTVLGLVALSQRERAETATAAAVSRQLAAQSMGQIAEQRGWSILTALEALQATEADGLRLPVAEEALRAALKGPAGVRLPGLSDQPGPQGPVNAVAFSFDGSMLVAGSDDSTALLWNVADPNADPMPLSGHEGRVTAVAFSEDGRWLATGGDDTLVLLWNLADPGAPPRRLQHHRGGITAVEFSSDGGWLATGSLDEDAILWDLDEPTSEPIVLTGQVGFVRTLAFSPDDSLLVTAGGGDNLAFVWAVDGRTDQPLHRLDGHSDHVTSVAFATGGSSVATGSSDATVRLWNLNGDLAAPLVLSHEAPVNTLSFSEDGSWLASGGEDNAVRLWNLKDPVGANNSPIVLPHSGVVKIVAFDGQSRWLATGSGDNTVRLFEVDDLSDPLILGGHEDQVTTLDFSPDQRWLSTGSDDGSARLWDLNDLSTRPVVLLHEPAVSVGAVDATPEVAALAFSPDGRQLATGTRDKMARVWDLDDLDAVPVPISHPDLAGFPSAGITAVSFSPDGRWLATGSGDSVVRLWDLNNPAAESKNIEQPDFVTTLGFSPDGRWLATGTKNTEVNLWDLEDLEAPAIPLVGHNDQVNSLSFSVDGKWLATASRDKAVLLWRPDRLDAEPERLEAHQDFVTALAFSKDGNRLATGGRDATVRLWNLDAESASVQELLGTDGQVNGLTFASDGDLLVIATERSVELWDLTVPDPTDPVVNPVVLSDHRGSVTAVAASTDGRWFATAGTDGTVRVWQPVDALRTLGCRLVGRNFTIDEWQDLLPGEPYRKTCEQWPAGP